MKRELNEFRLPISEVVNKILFSIKDHEKSNNPIYKWADVFLLKGSTTVLYSQYCGGVLATQTVEKSSDLWGSGLSRDSLEAAFGVAKGSPLEKEMGELPHQLSNHRHLIPARKIGLGYTLCEGKKQMSDVPIVVNVLDYEPSDGCHSPKTFYRFLERRAIIEELQMDEGFCIENTPQEGRMMHNFTIVSPHLSVRIDYIPGRDEFRRPVEIKTQSDGELVASLRLAKAVMSQDYDSIKPRHLGLREEFHLGREDHQATDRLYRAMDNGIMEHLSKFYESFKYKPQ